MYCPKINRLTCQLIRQIGQLTPPDIKELMKYEHPDGTFATLEEQLFAEYGRLNPFVRPEGVKVTVARIGEKNRLNLEKLKQEQQFYEILRNPENYWKESIQRTDSDKDSAVIGTADAISQGSNFAQTKVRSGGSQSYEEYDLEGTGDRSDENTLKSLLEQPKRSVGAKDYTISKGEEGRIDLVTTAVPQGEAKDITLQTQRTEEQTLALDSITISSNRAYNTPLTNTSSSTGKDIKSKKLSTQHTKTFTKADAIDALQKMQGIDGRARIIRQFACLFQGDGQTLLCL